MSLTEIPPYVHIGPRKFGGIKVFKVGDKVRLNPETWPGMRIREWIVELYEGEKIMLRAPEGGVYITVNPEEIEKL